MNRIQLHLFYQVLQAVLIIVGGLVLMALLAQGLSQTDVILEDRQSVFTYFYIVMLGAPQIIALLTPLALFVASIWALNRIHKDSEIVVASAAGMTRWQVASPLIRLALMAAMLHLTVNLWVQPTAQRAMRAAVSEARADLAASLIRPGQFTTNGERLTFYARDQIAGQLQGVFISDRTDPEFPMNILARSAALVDRDDKPTLYLRDATVLQLDDQQQLSVLEFEEYMFELKDFMKEDSGLNLKASDKFLHELFFIDRKDFFQLQDADKLLAEAHARLSSPLLSLVMVLIAIYAVLGGDFSRRGYDRRIAYATGGALLVLAVQLALQSEASNEPALNALQWIVPVATIGGLAYAYFGRGRHIGAAPQGKGPRLSRNGACA